MPFLDHLEELRERLIKCCASLLIGTIIGFFLAPRAIDIMIRPAIEAGLIQHGSATVRLVVSPDGTLKVDDPKALLALAPGAGDHGATMGRLEFIADGKPLVGYDAVSRHGLVYLGPMDPLTVQLKMALALGILFSVPLLLYQFYSFVSPGMYPHERQWIGPCVAAGTVLFPLGATFAYFMLKYALLFFSQYAAPDANMANDIRQYMSLALTTMVAFGVVFELPLATLVATRVGLVTTDFLAERRKHVFVILMVVSAVATPTGDPFTLAAMTLPLYALFELSLILSRMADAAAARRAHDTAPEVPS